MQICVLGGRPLLEAASGKRQTPLAIENVLDPGDELPAADDGEDDDNED